MTAEEWWGDIKYQPEKNISLLIATLSCRNPKWQYMASIGALRGAITRGDFGRYGLTEYAEHFEFQCSLLPDGRQRIFDYAMETAGISHVLWVDDDIEFQPMAVAYMLSRQMPIVAANYLRKGIPPKHIADQLTDGMLWTAKRESGVFISSFGKTGIENCTSCGLGLMLMETRTLRTVPRPHFEVLWNPFINSYDGEDIYFTKKALAHGILSVVDHDASALVGHIGDYSYNQQNHG